MAKDEAYRIAEKKIEKARRSGTKVLNLSVGFGDEKLTELPESLGQLTQLQSLELSGNQLTELPEWLGQLTQLRSLYLRNNQLTALPKSLGQLTRLRILVLGSNRLTALPKEIGLLSALSEFLVYDNELTTIPPELAYLPRLAWLDFERNKLISLPKELISLPEQANICLGGNLALGLPSEIVGSDAPELYSDRSGKSHGNARSIVSYYLRISEPDRATPLNEFKLILVGRGEVGKTTLVEKLVTDKFVKFEKTPGVKITRWPMKIGRDEVRAHVWDFGGQEIMHGTHRFFMTERAVYLVLVSKRTGMEDHDADYWLSLIRSFAGKEVPVILLLHRWGEEQFELNKVQLTQKYGQHLCFIETDCGEPPKKEKNVKKLRQAIGREAAKLPGLKAKWPKVWRSVKEDLPKAQKNWLTFGDFEKFCTAHGVPKEDHEVLAERLHDLGLMLAYRNDPVLRGFGVLNSMWVTDGIYKLLNSPRLQGQKGRLSTLVQN